MAYYKVFTGAEPAIEALGLVSKYRRESPVQSQIEKFPTLFEGLGKLEGQYTIVLEENAHLNTPYESR